MQQLRILRCKSFNSNIRLEFEQFIIHQKINNVKLHIQLDNTDDGTELSGRQSERMKLNADDNDRKRGDD